MQKVVKKDKLDPINKKRMISNNYYMHEIDRHLQILSSGCNRHMYVPVLNFDCSVSQTYKNAQIHACTCTHIYNIGMHKKSFLTFRLSINIAKCDLNGE